MNDAREAGARGPIDPPELLEAARAAGARDPSALLEDARVALGADALAERIVRATRRERERARTASTWRRVAAVLVLGGAAALAARYALRAARPQAPAADELVECVRRDRAELERALPLFARAGAAAGTEGALLGELLVARSEGVAAYAFPEWLNDAARLPRATALERVLWAELLCDRYVLLGQHPLLLAELLDGAADAEVAPLREHALARADRLGLRDDARSTDAAATALSETWLKQLAAQAAVQADAQAQRWVASALQP
ncbi:MAG: hypothetical protein EPO68_13540 [Planctomycetota bacterium]|nr:MAG: hypothetical protein EPO68_13540 [Planctomycetota bacterium]